MTGWELFAALVAYRLAIIVIYILLFMLLVWII